MNTSFPPRRDYVTLDRTTIESLVTGLGRKGLKVLTGGIGVTSRVDQIPVHMPTLTRLACRFPILEPLQEQVLGELKK